MAGRGLLEFALRAFVVEIEGEWDAVEKRAIQVDGRRVHWFAEKIPLVGETSWII